MLVKNSDLEESCLLLLSQKFCAWIANLALSSTFALLRWNLSPLKDCSIGSTSTFGQTSVRSCAVTSLLVLWQMEGMAPLGHLNTWLTIKS